MTHIQHVPSQVLSHLPGQLPFSRKIILHSLTETAFYQLEDEYQSTQFSLYSDFRILCCYTYSMWYK